MPVQKHPPAKVISNILTADWFWALCILLGAILLPSPSANATTVLGLPKLCIFRNVTGIACPGCGMTRSLIATGHLHFQDALSFHPLGPFVFITLVAYSFSFLRRHRPARDAALITRQWQLAIPIIVAICFGAVWLARLMGYVRTPS